MRAVLNFINTKTWRWMKFADSYETNLIKDNIYSLFFAVHPHIQINNILTAKMF